MYLINKTMKSSFLIGFLSLTVMLNACKSSVVEQQSNTISTTPDALNQLKGTWILKRRFLSDAYDTPCGVSSDKQSRDISLNFTDVKNDKSLSESSTYNLNGLSSVNNYGGSFRVTSFSNKTEGTIQISQLLSTKMASISEEMNQCEATYLNFLSTATDFKLVKNSANVLELHLGKFYHGTTPSRDGGTYLIFEQVK